MALSFVAADGARADDWEPLPPLPEPNGGFVGGVIGKRLVIVGGTNWESGTKNWLRNIFEFDPVMRKWEQRKDPHEGPVAYAVAMQRKNAPGINRFEFVGGTDGKRPLRGLGSVDGIGTARVPIDDLPASVVLSAGGMVDDRMLIVGGTDDAANLAGLQRSCHGIEKTKQAWKVSRLSDYPGKPFCTAASAVAGMDLLVFGGANWDADAKAVVNTSEAYAFSIETNAWRKLEPLPFAVRGMTAVALDDQRIYLAGGYRTDPEGFTDEALVYDARTGRYAPARPLPYKAMAGLVRLDDHVYCLGGEDRQKSRTNKFFRIRAAALCDE